MLSWNYSRTDQENFHNLLKIYSEIKNTVINKADNTDISNRMQNLVKKWENKELWIDEFIALSDEALVLRERGNQYQVHTDKLNENRELFTTRTVWERQALCNTSSSMIVSEALRNWFSAKEFEVKDLFRLATWIDNRLNTSSFGHTVSILKNNNWDIYLADNTFMQFFNKSGEQIDIDIGEVIVWRWKIINDEMSQSLFKKWYIKLESEKDLAEYLRITTTRTDWIENQIWNLESQMRDRWGLTEIFSDITSIDSSSTLITKNTVGGNMDLDYVDIARVLHSDSEIPKVGFDNHLNSEAFEKAHVRSEDTITKFVEHKQMVWYDQRGNEVFEKDGIAIYDDGEEVWMSWEDFRKV